MSDACESSRKVFLEKYFFCVCFKVNIVLAVQFNMRLTPLPNQGLIKIKTKKTLAFYIEELSMGCSSCELLMMISAFKSCEVKCFVCLFAYIVWIVSLLCLFLTIACFNHTFLLSNDGN